MVLLTGCGSDKKAETSETINNEVSNVSANIIETNEAENSEPQKPWSEEDLAAITQTLSGECYDDKEKDKRLVCEVILNRVSDGRFGETIYEVVSAKNQFVGYWNPSRPVSENDIKVAEQALQDWHDNECRALSKYLFFSAGSNRENIFYENIN